jgi:paraquat-inducible protein A
MPDRSDVVRSTALVAAGYFLFFLAYYFPMSYTVQPNGIRARTVFIGMRELIQAGFWYLAAIILIASFLIPLLKLVGLSWLLLSVHRRSTTHLVFKTRLHRLIHHIGRWSNVDPFIVAMSVPLMSYTGIVTVHATTAALPFALIVALTMLASRSFDPRLLWDAADGRHE